MMTKKLLPAIVTLFLFTQAKAPAQYLYVFSFAGTSATTDTNGVIVVTPTDNRTLLHDYAALNGIKDYSWLGLAYHVNGSVDFNGDTIDVINRTNGTVYSTLFGLYFGEAFGRMALLSGSRRQLKRIEYIYTDQNSHSLGSALLTDYYFLDSNGNTNSTYIFGNMQYLVLPNALHTNVAVCTGNFHTIGLWRFQ